MPGLIGGLLFAGCAGRTTSEVTAPSSKAGPAEIAATEVHPTRPVPPKPYRVGSGDILRIEVNGGSEKEFSGNFEIDGKGAIDFPFLGYLPVSGKNEEEIAGLLTELLSKDYLVEPRVKVAVADYQSQKVTILGAVKTPGNYLLKKNRDLLSVLGQAGGLIDKEGSTVLVLRQPAATANQADPTSPERGKDGQVENIMIDMANLTAKGDMSQNIELKNGDIINVQGTRQVFVYGSVKKPGAVPFTKGMTVREALGQAGGETQEADLGGAYILRGQKSGKEQKIKVNLSQIMKGKAPPVAMEEGDFLTIPESFF